MVRLEELMACLTPQEVQCHHLKNQIILKMQKIRQYIIDKKLIPNFVLAFPVVCNIWIIGYMCLILYLPVHQNSLIGFKYILGHALALNLFLLACSIVFLGCLWNQLLIISLILISIYSFMYEYCGLQFGEPVYVILFTSVIFCLLSALKLFYGRKKNTRTSRRIKTVS